MSSGYVWVTILVPILMTSIPRWSPILLLGWFSKRTGQSLDDITCTFSTQMWSNLNRIWAILRVVMSSSDIHALLLSQPILSLINATSVFRWEAMFSFGKTVAICLKMFCACLICSFLLLMTSWCFGWRCCPWLIFWRFQRRLFPSI